MRSKSLLVVWSVRKLRLIGRPVQPINGPHVLPRVTLPKSRLCDEVRFRHESAWLWCLLL